MESPLTATREKPLLAKTRESPCTTMETQRNHKQIKFKSAHGTALLKCFPPQEKVLNLYRARHTPYALASLTFRTPVAPHRSILHSSLCSLPSALHLGLSSLLLLSGSARGLSLRISSLEHHLDPV